MEVLDLDSLRNVLVSTGSLRDVATLAETNHYLASLFNDRSFLDSLSEAFHIPTGMKNIREMVTYSEMRVYDRIIDAINRKNLPLVKFLIEDEGSTTTNLRHFIVRSARVGADKILEYIISLLPEEKLLKI
jgi:hypothetical protein